MPLNVLRFVCVHVTEPAMEKKISYEERESSWGRRVSERERERLEKKVEKAIHGERRNYRRFVRDGNEMKSSKLV